MYLCFLPLVSVSLSWPRKEVFAETSQTSDLTTDAPSVFVNFGIRLLLVGFYLCICLLLPTYKKHFQLCAYSNAIDSVQPQNTHLVVLPREKEILIAGALQFLPAVFEARRGQKNVANYTDCNLYWLRYDYSSSWQVIGCHSTVLYK